MSMNYILIDYENVQPADLAGIEKESLTIKVFLGPQQRKLPVEFVAALQVLGGSASYERIAVSGKNAMDMVIAWSIGALSSADPAGRFFVISKDTDFDPLIAHLRERKVAIRRIQDFGDLPFAKKGHSSGEQHDFQKAVAYLENLKSTKPAADKTLRRALAACFKSEGVSEERISAVIDLLLKRGIIGMDGKKLKYHFSKLA